MQENGEAGYQLCAMSGWSLRLLYSQLGAVVVLQRRHASIRLWHPEHPPEGKGSDEEEYEAPAFRQAGSRVHGWLWWCMKVSVHSRSPFLNQAAAKSTALLWEKRSDSASPINPFLTPPSFSKCSPMTGNSLTSSSMSW